MKRYKPLSGSIDRWFLLLGVVILVSMLFMLVVQTTASNPTTPAGSVTGSVVDDQGPLSDATVRWRATENSTTTNTDGRFSLSNLPIGQPIEIAAWADGYYISSTMVTPPAENITLTLRLYHTEDHPAYEWLSPIPGSSESACGNCHPMIIDQWKKNAHGLAIENDRFYSLYNGTNLDGSQEVGSGYLTDFPNTAGLCANCHAPAAAIDGYLTTDMNDVRGQVTAGILCDYCHKVGGVYLNPATGSVYPNAPGAQSQRVLRPPAGDQIFFGPYDDIKDPDTFLPVISESAYCAPCHQFSFWGTPIYESYDEWLASPYASQEITCQDCHMPPNGDEYFVLPEKGGLPHPPETIPSHLQLGGSDVELLKGSLDLDVRVYHKNGHIEATVTITNSGAGHHLPTDFPGRQLILIASAVDSQGRPLEQLTGPRIPDWGGPQAGQAGKIYAKILMDVESGDFPVVSYWKQALIHSDNRIAALAADSSSYGFELPGSVQPGKVTVKLYFRRIFQPVADEKEWDKPDILLTHQTLDPWHQFYIPIIYNSRGE